MNAQFVSELVYLRRKFLKIYNPLIDLIQQQCPKDGYNNVHSHISMVFILFILFGASKIHASNLIVGNHHGFYRNFQGFWSVWGGNLQGELALGDANVRFTPSHSGYPDVQKLASGGNHGCALFAQNKIKCWGENRYGELGLGSTAQEIGKVPNESLKLLPDVNLGTSSNLSELALGYSHSCVVFSGGTLKCFGRNSFGELGIGSTAPSVGSKPSDMGEALPWVDVGGVVKHAYAGRGFTCALMEDGRLKCWGNYLAIGSGAKKNVGGSTADMGINLKPLDLGEDEIRIVAPGSSHVCVLFASGTIQCWGNNGFGVLGIGLPESTVIGDDVGEMGNNLRPVFLEPGMPAKNLACGFSHCCAVLANDGLKCWGENSKGQLGLGDTRPRGLLAADMGSALPYVDLGLTSPIQHLSLGTVHSCAEFSTGEIKCWGANSYGQLGLGKEIGTLGHNPTDMGVALPALVFPKEVQ